MPTLRFVRSHNINLLHDELLAAFPAWRGERGADGWTNSPLSLESNGKKTFWITVPEDADLAAVQAIVEAHDFHGQGLAQQIDERRQVAMAAAEQADFAGLRAAIGAVKDPAVQAALEQMAGLLYDLAAGSGLTRQEKPTN